MRWLTPDAVRDFLACLGLTLLFLRVLAWVLARSNRFFAMLLRDWHRDEALRLTLRLGQWR